MFMKELILIKQANQKRMVAFTTGVFQTMAVIFNQMSQIDVMIQMSLHVMLPKARTYVKSYDG